jgi:hypothetical protein
MHSGFCGTRLTNVWNMLKESRIRKSGTRSSQWSSGVPRAHWSMH